LVFEKKLIRRDFMFKTLRQNVLFSVINGVVFAITFFLFSNDSSTATMLGIFVALLNFLLGLFWRKVEKMSSKHNTKNKEHNN